MMPEISLSRALRAITYMSISFFFVWLINTGKLNHIVHPRMNPWIIAAGLLFLVMAFSETLHLSVRPHRDDPPSHFYPFAFVLIVAYIFVQAASLHPGSFQPAGESLDIQSAAIAQRGRIADAATLGPLPSWIQPTDDSYWPLYNRLYDHPEAAIGKRITVQGFVYKKKGFPPGSALIGRNLMWCCSADMAVIGYLAHSPTLGLISDSSWVEVTGTLRSILFDPDGSGKASDLPFIEVESIKPVERSASTTIFPY